MNESIKPRSNVIVLGVSTALVGTLLIIFLIVCFITKQRPYVINVTVDPRTDKASQAQPVTKPPINVIAATTADWKIEMGPLVQESFDSSGWELHAIVTPLKHQTDYGELRCAFYSAQNHVVGTTMANWVDDPHADPIDTDLSFHTDGGSPDHGKCWIHQL